MSTGSSRLAQASDYLRNARTRLHDEMELACAALQEGMVQLREANERIRYLERKNEDLRDQLQIQHAGNWELDK